MEYYQGIQNRATQTVAVIKQHFPTMSVGAITAEQLSEMTRELGRLAQQRDDALTAFDATNGAEEQSFLAIRALTLTLPKMAQGELDDRSEAGAALLDLLSPVFAVDPRSSEAAIKRAKRLVSVLTHIDAHLAAQTPARAPIRSGGKGAAELAAAIEAHARLTEQLEDRSTEVATARAALRLAATTLDRLNKRFYVKLKAEARGDAALTRTLEQIDTTSNNLPATLSIRDIRQGGAENRQLLVSYIVATYDDGATNLIEWRVGDGHEGFPHALPVDPSGNALGPFANGSRVQLRTRVNNSNGTTTGSVRTVEIG